LNLYSEYLTTDALEGFGDFKKGPAIRTVKWANECLLLAKEKTMLQGSTNMTGTNCDLFTHKSSRSYLNHVVQF
jgi:hypothetical protein